MSQRNLKVVHLSEHLFRDLLASLSFPPPFVMALPKLNGLPDGYRIVSITHDFYRKCFAAIIEHESFPEVPDGCMIPDFQDGVIDYAMVKFVRANDVADPPTFVESPGVI